MVRLARSLSIAVAALMGLVVSTIGAGIFAASEARAADVFRVAYAGAFVRKALTGIAVRGDTVRSAVTPDDYASEEEAQLAAEQAIRKV